MFRVYLGAWFHRAADHVMSSWNLLAGAASILGFFSLTSANTPWAPYVFGPYVLYLFYTIWKSRPKFATHPSAILNRRIELEELASLATKIPQIALVGPASVGKTTFLDAAAGRVAPKRRTEKPYARILQVPDKNPPSYIAFIDTVGQHEPGQFETVKQADVACLFLDHNASDASISHDKERTRQQLHFVSQITGDLLSSEKKPRRVILILNKADLWQRQAKVATSVKTFGSESEKTLAPLAATLRIDPLVVHSNRKSDDVADLFKRIQDAAEA